MTSRATSISADSTITIHVPGGQDQTILWADLVTDLLAEMVAGSRLVLPQADEAATPTLAFGDGSSGWYEPTDNVLKMALAGIVRWTFQTNLIGSASSLEVGILKEAPTTINPNLCPAHGDPDTGVGGTADALSLISGGVQGIGLPEVGGGIVQVVNSDVGLTAHTDSGQGDGPILSSYNVYSTVAVAGDAATLPAVFKVGSLVYVKNDAATNSMDVFPASGDDAGGGSDTAVAVAAGDFALFMGTLANATWTKIMGGTA